MSIFFRKCKRCGKIYDIGINKDVCHDCELINKDVCHDCELIKEGEGNGRH